MAPTSAARTNLTSTNVHISNTKIGDGAFRDCFLGTYVGGNRNQQEAACKRFKPRFRIVESEYFAADFRIADRVIEYAEEWNGFCPDRREIIVSRGDLHKSNSGIQYLVEPYIRDFTKFTSNSGWIAPGQGWDILALEAFSHYSYHRSGGMLLVCDLQGRYRKDKFGRGAKNKSRFELSDPAISELFRHLHVFLSNGSQASPRITRYFYSWRRQHYGRGGRRGEFGRRRQLLRILLKRNSCDSKLLPF
jgi:Alpha-kinase family